MKAKPKLALALVFICELASAEVESSKINPNKVADMDMADLLRVKVTSVSKKAQALSDAPSAVFVISNEDIKRSGVATIPEALRMAPGIDVARVNSSKWAISSRGFNGSYANKLLVLIDGRSVYTPAFSGVYWDAQDVLLEDVDRIEVIRGPGATLWGANAVNGVINVITKHSENTQGGLLTGGGGTRETGFGAVRYGKQLTKDTFGRAYVKGFVRDNFKTPSGGENAGDGWDRVQGGFRVDSRLSSQDELTVQGDLYRTNFGQIATWPSPVAPFFQEKQDSGNNEGWNLTSRLNHKFSSTSEYSLQFYYDHTKREEFFINQVLDTLDIDFQHSFELTDNQNLIWGLGYRANMDEFGNTYLFKLLPKQRNTQLFNAFVQDEIMLIDNALWLSLGSKFEHNDYTGFEGQPSARLLWAPSPKQRLWAAFSRSVRTPARAEQDITALRTVIPPNQQVTVPTEVSLNGNPDYRAEVQLAYELGYRFSFSDKASLDFTAFFNDYDKLRSTNVGTLDYTNFPSSILQPLKFANSNKGKTYGFEAATIWQMTDWWRWETNYSLLHTRIDETQNTEGVSPQHKLSIRALINPIDQVDLDLWLRYNGSTKAITPRSFSSQIINEYVTLDVRLAWKPKSNIELSLVGQNLLADKHLEYFDENFVNPSYVPRSVYGKIALEF